MRTSCEAYVVTPGILSQAYHEKREDYAKNIFGRTSKELNESDLKEMAKINRTILSQFEIK